MIKWENSMECFNKCLMATINITWLTSRGPVSLNFCDECAENWWAMWKHSPIGIGATFSEVKSDSEMAAINDIFKL